MARLLTDRQARELHKSIIAYLAANGLPQSATELQKELNLDITALESRKAALQSELDSLASASSHKRDPESWLPQHPRYSLNGHQGTINCIAFHSKYTSIASGSDDFTIKIWDWELGELEVTLKGHTQIVRGLDYGCPSGVAGALLASCSSDFSIKIWDPADEYKNTRTLQGHDHIAILAECEIFPLLPTGKFLLSTGDDMTVRLWDISTNPGNGSVNPKHKLTLIGHQNFNECCSIAPPTSYQYLAPLAKVSTASAAEFMAAGSRDKTIKIWDAHGTCLMTLIGHDNWVRSIVFHPGGRYLLSVSDDKTLRCWDLSQGGMCVKILRDVHDQFVTCLKWAPGVTKDLSTDIAASASDVHMPQVNGIAKGKIGGQSSPDMRIRCVVATGSVDQKLRVFVG
ncbi:unnamed protein product [Penicillium glandicola]